jgi:hypothetical protein
VTLTNFPHDPLLDLDPWIGQRSASFRFERINAVTGEFLGEINPLRNAQLSHDTTRTIKRQLSITLGVVDTAAINSVQERVDLYMVFPGGQEYPLGRYMYTDQTRQKFTSGNMSTCTLNDEMFRVDQPLEVGLNGTGRTVLFNIELALSDITDIELTIEGGSIISNSAWTIGAARGQVLETLALTGDYFSPWFGNDRKLHFIRTFDPADQVPDFDFDAGNQVLRAGIVENDNLLTAPNRFIVISNNAEDPSEPAVGSYDIPRNAPNSIENRGFVIAKVTDTQATNPGHADLIARNIGIRETVFETVNLTTAPDPRHDSYNVIQWDGSLWLELGWTMSLIEGGTMNHIMRKSYSA